MIICVENEVQQKKIIELDARLSDCIAVATQRAPISVSLTFGTKWDDMTDVLRKMEEEGPSRIRRRSRPRKSIYSGGESSLAVILSEREGPRKG